MTYETDWAYQGRVMMTAMVEPARQFDIVLRTAAGQSEQTRLRGSFLENTNIIKMAEEIQRRVLALSGRRSFPEALRLTEQRIGPPLRNLAAITPAQLKQEELGKRDFVMARLGVSAPQAIVILSAALLESPRQIEACITACRRDEALPELAAPEWSSRMFSNRAVARTTQWLRLQERTDRNAQSYGNGSPDDKAGHKMVRKTLKIFKANPPYEAQRTLKIDHRQWFED